MKPSATAIKLQASPGGVQVRNPTRGETGMAKAANCLDPLFHREPRAHPSSPPTVSPLGHQSLAQTWPPEDREHSLTVAGLDPSRDTPSDTGPRHLRPHGF